MRYDQDRTNRFQREDIYDRDREENRSRNYGRGRREFSYMPSYGLGRFDGNPEASRMQAETPSYANERNYDRAYDREDDRNYNRYDRAYEQNYEGLGRHGLYPSQSADFERVSTSGYSADSNFGGRSYGSFGNRAGSGRYFGHTHNDYDPSYYRDRDYRSQEYRGARENEHGMWESVKDFFGKGPKGYRRSDERITEDVNDALTRDRNIDASDIEVSVKDGVVTLTGNVSDKWMKRQAEDCAEEVTGVNEVRNQIEVRTEARRSLGTASEAGQSKETESKRRSA